MLVFVIREYCGSELNEVDLSITREDSRIMSLAVFISCSEYKQVTELKRFLRSRGAKALDTSEGRPDNWVVDLMKCIECVKICWLEDSISDTEVSDVLNTLASLVIQLPCENLDEVVRLLCSAYLDFSGDNPKKHTAKLLSLNLLFHGLPADRPCKCLIFLTLVGCATELGRIHQIVTDPKKVSIWLDACCCSIDERRRVWRTLTDTHFSLGQKRKATEALVYLLLTYNEKNAAEARSDAVKCIISVLQDPSLLAQDQLYSIKAVQYLEGEPVHDLFKIFISGDLASFTGFVNTHSGFLQQNNLDEAACLHKLRLLILMQISEDQTEISYEYACKELNLTDIELEPFLIEAVRQRAVAYKLDQAKRRILITGAFPRTFGRPQWMHLRDTLVHWRSGLNSIQSNIGSMFQSDLLS